MSKVKNHIWLAIYKPIYLEKINLVQYKNVKKSIETRHTKASAKIKLPRSDTESIQRPKSVAVSILLPMSNIPITFDDIFDPNQAFLTVTSSFLHEIINICLSIYEKKICKI